MIVKKATHWPVVQHKVKQCVCVRLLTRSVRVSVPDWSASHCWEAFAVGTREEAMVIDVLRCGQRWGNVRGDGECSEWHLCVIVFDCVSLKCLCVWVIEGFFLFLVVFFSQWGSNKRVTGCNKYPFTQASILFRELWRRKRFRRHTHTHVHLWGKWTRACLRNVKMWFEKHYAEEESVVI